MPKKLLDNQMLNDSIKVTFDKNSELKKTRDHVNYNGFKKKIKVWLEKKIKAMQPSMQG